MNKKDDISDIEIGNRVKGLLNIFHVSRSDLAKDMGISYNTLTKKLNGKREFTYKDFKVIQKKFGLNYNVCGDVFFNPMFLVEKLISLK